MTRSKPTIAFFGSSLVSAYWNGAATYYRGIIKYLDRLGYSVTFYEPDVYDRQEYRDMPDPDWAKVRVYRNNLPALEEVVDEAAASDIIVKASGVGVFDEELEKMIPAVRKPWQRIILWDVDAPATLESIFRNPEAYMRELIPDYDLIFTYGGGDPVVNAYKSLGAIECIPIYNALDPETHYRVHPVPKFTCDLSFLGNRLPDREERVKEFFLNVAGKNPGKSFILGGSGWTGLSLDSNIRYVNHVFSRDHNAFNSSAGMVLNISRQSMADYGYSPATRVFEAAGAAACIITDYWQGIEDFLVPGTEILVASGGDEVSDFLRNVTFEEALKIGRAAKKKVLADHTYSKRAMQLDDILTEKEVTVNI